MNAVSLISRAVRRYLPPGSGVLFTTSARRRYVLVLLGSLVLAGLELAGMAALLMLLQQFTGAAIPNFASALVESVWGRSEPRLVLVVLAVLVLLIYAAKAVTGLAFRRWVILFMQEEQASTSVRLLVGYLNGPYWKVLGRNSADLVRTMYDGTASVYGRVVGSIIQIAIEGATMLAILTFLLATMPAPTLGAIVFFAICFLTVNRLIRARATRAGQIMLEAGSDAYRAMLQALAGTKEIKVRRTQGHFIDEFRSARMRSAHAGATADFLAEAPKYVFEVLFVVAIILVAGLVSLTSEPGQTLPLIAIFAAAGIRLLPSAVRMVAMVGSVRTGLPQMESVVADLLADLQSAGEADEMDAAPDAFVPLAIQRSLTLHDLHYRYPGAEVEVIRGVSIDVPAGTSLAVVGPSGAGKSTLIDLILGLHQPTHGTITVDGRTIADLMPVWQRSIGLVPQEVFVLDDTLRRNVTLGSPSRNADGQVLDALSMAHLDDFLAELPDGLDTRLGERGSRVSGGQRQRIGIARALFVNPSLLVLDEATSALDNEAESHITKAIEGLRGQLTTIVVAHRLSTIRHCDRVALLQQGRITASGTFDEVEQSNPSFAHLVELGRL